jgi:hypothetical protein
MKIKSPKYRCFFALLLVFLLGTGTVWAGVLNVQQHNQEQDQWCWAACSQAILEYYRTIKTQTQIAQYGTNGVNTWNWYYGSSAADNPNPGDPPRNGINLILLHFAKLATTHYANSLAESSVKSQIDARRPFVIRWAWDSGGGHFVVARGLVSDNMYLMDPMNGPTINTYSWVVGGSSPGRMHTWTHTLTMNASPPVMTSIFNLLLFQ